LARSRPPHQKCETILVGEADPPFIFRLSEIRRQESEDRIQKTDHFVCSIQYIVYSLQITDNPDKPKEPTLALSHISQGLTSLWLEMSEDRKQMTEDG